MKFESIYANYSVDESQEMSELAIQNRRNHREGGGGENFSFLRAKKLENFRLFPRNCSLCHPDENIPAKKDGIFFQRVTKCYWKSLNLRNIKGISWKEQNLTIGWWTQQTHTHGPRFWLNLVGRTLDCCNPDFGGSFCFRPRRNLNVKREPADSPLRY